MQPNLLAQSLKSPVHPVTRRHSVGSVTWGCQGSFVYNTTVGFCLSSAVSCWCFVYWARLVCAVEHISSAASCKASRQAAPLGSCLWTACCLHAQQCICVMPSSCAWPWHVCTTRWQSWPCLFFAGLWWCFRCVHIPTIFPVVVGGQHKNSRKAAELYTCRCVLGTSSCQCCSFHLVAVMHGLLCIMGLVKLFLTYRVQPMACWLAGSCVGRTCFTGLSRVQCLSGRQVQSCMSMLSSVLALLLSTWAAPVAGCLPRAAGQCTVAPQPMLLYINQAFDTLHLESCCASMLFCTAVALWPCVHNPFWTVTAVELIALHLLGQIAVSATADYGNSLQAR